ncbi:hypothetical protein HMPREF9064_1196 [Aggregatibacter segnis ATCC 33393]|uniref:Uncharacterized protein n=1 Tax=Aggregatibacter segnis ATCC 33393 TaxID=888057 RepID=E6KYG4_9PAST|nr:hypothetical protein HMPREF9064_1196 [Aggregatibacter segnis ATCC 33393]
MLAIDIFRELSNHTPRLIKHFQNRPHFLPEIGKVRWFFQLFFI